MSDASTVLYTATVSADDPIMVAATREGLALVRLQTGASELLLANRFVRDVAWRPAAQ